MAGRRIAPPNWVAVNPSNGHAHMVYGLSIPVKTADPEHIKALRYFAAVYDAMAVALKADLNYSGLLTKNPTHEKWRTEWVYNALYELSELAEYVSLTNVQKCAESDSRGFGRNCTVFDKLRLWAYVAVRQYRASSIVAWREAVYAQAQSCNEFESPLSVNEVRAIGKSVAKWVWARDADAEAKFIARQSSKGKGNSSEVQASKGRKGGKANGLANFNKRVAAEALRADGYTQKETAKALGVSQSTVSGGRKILMTCLGLISDLGYFVFVNMFMNIGKQPKSDISPEVFGGLVLSGQKQVPLRELRPFLLHGLGFWGCCTCRFLW